MGWSACRSTMEGPHPEGPNHRNRGRTPRRGQSSGGVDAPRSGLEDVPPAAMARLAARRAPSPSAEQRCSLRSWYAGGQCWSTEHAAARPCTGVPPGRRACGVWRVGEALPKVGGAPSRRSRRSWLPGAEARPWNRRLLAASAPRARRAPSPNSGAACSVAVPTSSAETLGTLTTLHRIPPGTRTSAVWRAVEDGRWRCAGEPSAAIVTPERRRSQRAGGRLAHQRPGTVGSLPRRRSWRRSDRDR